MVDLPWESLFSYSDIDYALLLFVNVDNRLSFERIFAWLGRVYEMDLGITAPNGLETNPAHQITMPDRIPFDAITPARAI